MTLMRRTPYADFFDLFQGMNRGPNWPARFEAGNERMAFADWKPACDIHENNEAYVVKAELPAVKREDVTLTLEDNILTLKGERKTEEVSDDHKVHRVERAFGSFQRSFQLPEAIDEDKIVATFNDGVLQVMLPKHVEPKAKAKSISID